MEKLYQIWKKFGKNFEEGGKLAKLSSFYDAFDTFLFTPQTTAKKNGAHIHDGSDSKRTMILVVMALVPAMLFGMFNVGYQHLDITGQLVNGLTCALFWKALGFGILAVLPFIIVSNEYDRVFPMDIYPEYLIKAMIAGNIDRMEALGAYEVAPEDFALCEFVCTSKMPLQAIVRTALDNLKKEIE